MAFLEFKSAGLSPSGKTQKWSVLSTGGVPLGEVKWTGPWRRYAFVPLFGTLFDATCLREAADFCEKMTTEHRSETADGN